MKLLLYCTKSKKQLFFDKIKQMFMFGLNGKNDKFNSLNGKIVAECDFEVEEIKKDYGTYHASFDERGYFNDYYDYMTKTIDEDILLKRSCLNIEELETYNPNYAIHIKNLHIFDKSKELSDYYSQGQVNWIEETELYRLKNGITSAPQNMRYAYKYSYSKGKLEKYILISIKPQWLCKILNGEKTIEVRKKVLKEMLE